MKTPNDPFRPDVQGRAKRAFEQQKARKPPAAREMYNPELDRWKKPRPELKPDGAAREVIDRRTFAENLHADAQNALSQAEQTAPPAHGMNENATISDLSSSEMAQALLENYNKSVAADLKPDLGR